jgi:DNA-binding SARP family transcriptional activator
VKFSILGPLTLRDQHGRLVTPRPLKVRAILAFLLLEPGRPVMAEQLIDQLWNFAPPRTARAALQVHVSKLRAQLAEPGLLVTVPSGYLLDLGAAHRLDLLDFHGLLDRARAARDAGQPHQAAGLLAEALNLWTGPPLADLRGFPVLARAAERLERTRFAAQERYIHLGLDLGNHSELITDITELVRRHPLHEELHESLMLALYRSGRIADSLSVYDKIRRELRSNLGLDPGPRLRKLLQLILAHDPDLQRRIS